MSGPAGADVTAVVLAARGGARLARTLASVAWAGERVVWDPAERLGDAPLPAGVACVVGTPRLEDLGTARWLLLLEEQDLVDAAAAAAIASATQAVGGADAFRLQSALHAFGGTLRVRGAPIRLSRRPGARLAIGSGLTLGIATRGPRPPRLDATLTAQCAPQVGEALLDLDADAAALAVVLHLAGVRARVGYLLVTPVVAAARLLVARGGPALGWGRWIASVLVGYRALAAYAKLWEVARRQSAVSW